jgi:hypothetical protein
MNDHMPALRAALTDLGNTFEALDPFQRVGLARVMLTAYEDKDTPADLKPWLLSVHDLTEGATPERLDHHVSVLEVSSALREGVRDYADDLQRLDPFRAVVWAALGVVADNVRP